MRTFFFVAMAAVVVCGTVSGQNNVLVNPGFELNPPPNDGNNLNHPIAPWILGPGNQANVVKVDGPGTGPGNFNYGNNGPHSDASAPGVNIDQHYLDIVGSNEFYQIFTPKCDGAVEFGGYFSTRADAQGTGSVTIRQGVGLAGPVVATFPVQVTPVNGSENDPWTLQAFSATLMAGTTYSFIVQMDNSLNFDNGYVRYRVDCTAAPPPNPCCPPWNAALYEDMLFYHGYGSIADPYTLKFVPTPAFISAMQSYINYVSGLTPATQITIHFNIYDAGTGNTPGGGVPVTLDYWTTWTAGGTTNSPAPTWFTESLQVNRWYRVHTGIYLEGGHTFFPPECADNDVFVRVQVLPAMHDGPVLQFRNAAGRVTEKPLD